MKLYFHPVSTTSRPIMMLAADEGIALDNEVVDLFSGAQLAPEYAAINPSQQVPVLEDGEFRLTEGSAILKYLADSVGSPAYPADRKQRARINERMDWFNTGLSRDLGYGLVYPQTLPSYKREDPVVQSGVLEWGRTKTRRWLDILDKHVLGANKFICGKQLSLVDYMGVSYLTLGEVIKLDYSPWSNVSRWIDTMKARTNWKEVNQGFYQYFVGGYKDQGFIGLQE